MAYVRRRLVEQIKFVLFQTRTIKTEKQLFLSRKFTKIAATPALMRGLGKWLIS